MATSDRPTVDAFPPAVSRLNSSAEMKPVLASASSSVVTGASRSRATSAAKAASPSSTVFPAASVAEAEK